MFMRYVKSELLYVQMKGRGVRTIGDDVLHNVTPNAYSKDLFYLVDAVGVSEGGQTVPMPTGPTPPPYPNLEELLERIAHGDVNDDYLNILASRISRIDAKTKDETRKAKFEQLAGVTMYALATRIFYALNPEMNALPPFTDINEPNTERRALVA